MDEFSEKLNRFFTIIKFIIFGPIYLVISLPVNSFVFALNLYSMAIED